jgi:flagellin-like hook-associated protein FlgL
MGVGGIGARSQNTVQALVDMRRQLDELQRQLGSGKKSTTYAGLGLDRGLTVNLRSELASLKSYDQTITMLDVRLSVAQNVLSRMTTIRGDAKSSLAQSAEIKSNTGQSAAQESARAQLDELLELLNTKAGERYLFSGRNVDQAAAESSTAVLNGDGARAGLTQIISERAQADLGVGNMGRLVTSATAGTMTLAEDLAGSPFGFKLAAVTSNLSNATISGPSGAPPAITAAFTGLPTSGESITITLDQPDGTQKAITLKATTNSPAGVGGFTIGVDADATAVNLQSALSAAVVDAAKTSLAAASAMAAAEDFFNIGAGDPPLRVVGPPFDTATALVAGTPTDTVFWYKGEMNTDAARASAVVRVDASISVSYGMRANEEGIRNLLKSVGVFAATTFDPNDASTANRYAELKDRLGPALSNPPGFQKIEDISADLAGAQVTVAAAKERHTQTNSVLGGLLDQVEGVTPEEVGVEILALQTRLQASLQVTSMLYQLSLANYV